MIVNPYFYLIIALVIIIISSHFNVCAYFNISEVIKKYFENIIFDNNSTFINAVKMALFFIMPFCLSNAITLTNLIDIEIAENIVVIVSLLVSVIFSYYSRFIDYDPEDINDDYKYQVTKKILNNTAVVIRYEIIIAIFTIMLCFLYSTLTVNPYFEFILSNIIYAALIHLLMNLLLIVKREDKLN